MLCFARVLFVASLAILIMDAGPTILKALKPSTPVEIVPHCPAGDGMFLPCTDVRPTFSI